MKLIKTLLVISILVTILTMPITSADDDAFLLCLEKNQVVKFSKCNDLVRDYKCTGTKCQLCVTQNSDGTYCQASLNACNSGGGQCVPLSEIESTAPIITLESPENFLTTNPGTVNFQFELTKSSEVNSCKLLINSQAVSTKSPVSSLNSLSYSFEEASYLWKISCETNSETTVESETRVLYIIEKSNPPDEDTPINQNNPTDTENTNNEQIENNSNKDSNKNNKNNEIKTTFFDNNEQTQNKNVITLSTSQTITNSQKQNAAQSLSPFSILLSIMTIINVMILLFLQKIVITKESKNSNKKVKKK